MPSRGTSIISVAAAVAVLCFFLPWFLVSCQGEPMDEVSGWQLAAGVNYQDGYSTTFTRASTYHFQAAELFLVLLAALGCLVVVYLAHQRQITVRRAVSIVLGLAALSLLIVFYKIADVSADVADYGLQIKLRIGIWGTMLANAAAIVGAVLDLREQGMLERAGLWTRTATPNREPQEKAATRSASGSGLG